MTDPLPNSKKSTACSVSLIQKGLYPCISSYICTSAFGTCIQKYVIERYVCLIVFMVIAQTHVQAVATVHYLRLLRGRRST